MQHAFEDLQLKVCARSMATGHCHGGALTGAPPAGAGDSSDGWHSAEHCLPAPHDTRGRL